VSQSGFLTRTIARVRKTTNEPTVNAKYDDDDIILEIQSAYAELLAELNRNSKEPLSAYVDITMDGSTPAWVLPPTMGAILNVTTVTSNGDFLSHAIPSSRYNAMGRNWRISGNFLFVDPDLYTSSTIFRIEFEPTGSAELHEGTIDATSAIVTTGDYPVITLAAIPTAGALDTRDNAYAGSIFRILNDTGGSGTLKPYVQEHVIKSSDSENRTVTIWTDLSPTPGGTTMTYEIAPVLDSILDKVIAVKVSRWLVSNEGDSRRFKTISQQYIEMMRDMRLRFGKRHKFAGGKVNKDGHANRRGFVFEKHI